MASRTLIHSLRARSELPQSARTRSRAGRRRARLHRPQWDLFEDRTLLSTFLVTTAADNGDTTNPVPGSLRQAIMDVNNDTSNTGTDTIDFAIPGTGVQTIQPLTDLPSITHPVLVDGYSQAGSCPNTLADGDNAKLLIALDGSADTSGPIDGATSMHVTTGIGASIPDSTVRGINVSGFYHGIASFGVVEGNFIGTDPSGTQARGNAWGVYDTTLVGTNGDGVDDYAERNLISGNLNTGVQNFDPQDLVAGNFVGTDSTGTNPLGNYYGVTSSGEVSGNLISGNQFGIVGDSGSKVQGNKIGTDVTGHSALPNTYGVSASFSLIGGTAPGVGNLISGNSSAGILGNNSVIQGNLIGTDITGTAAVGNGEGIYDTFSETIGGTDPAARNIISGNYCGINYCAGNVLIEGNYIGTDVTGEVAIAGSSCGIMAAFGSTIGGTTPGAGNLISGNGIGIRSGGDSVIQGNFIGTNKEGTKSIGNHSGYYSDLTFGPLNETIGGTTPGAGNLISGNTDGVDVFGGTGGAVTTNFIIQGNKIGTDFTGSGPLGNDTGIALGDGVSANLVGGTTPGAGNIIAFNGFDGV